MAISFRLVVDAAASYATGPVASMSHHAPPLTVLATGLLVDSASAYGALSPPAATRAVSPGPSWRSPATVIAGVQGRIRCHQRACPPSHPAGAGTRTRTSPWRPA